MFPKPTASGFSLLSPDAPITSYKKGTQYWMPRRREEKAIDTNSTVPIILLEIAPVSHTYNNLSSEAIQYKNRVRHFDHVFLWAGTPDGHPPYRTLSKTPLRYSGGILPKARSIACIWPLKKDICNALFPVGSPAWLPPGIPSGADEANKILFCWAFMRS